MSSTRKNFLKGLAATAISLPVALRLLLGDDERDTKEESTIGGKRYEWKMVTTWPPGFPILGEGCNMLADLIRKMSNGRLNIEVYGSGELVPALESFTAVRQGAAQMGSGVPYYWAGTVAAAQFFAGYPFGLNAQQMNAWMISGGGMELWRELYADFGLVPFVGGNTGVQMGGWYNREINSVDDFKGLKMRMPGLGGRVLEALGGTPVLLAGGEIYTGLERGVIDATEWIGPYHDYIMGFHEITKYYYYPGWHEPGTSFEFFVNKEAYEALPRDLQAIVETATHYINVYTLAAFEAKNAEYLTKLQQVDTLSIRPFPEDVIAAGKKAAASSIADFAQQDPFSKRVYAAVTDFKKKAAFWGNMTEKKYYTELQ